MTLPFSFEIEGSIPMSAKASYRVEEVEGLQVGGPNWFEGMKRPRRSGAVAALTDDRLRLILPRGFLDRWHRAELATDGEAASLAERATSAELGQLLCVGPTSDRLEAAKALLSLGPKASAAVPALLVAMTGDQLAAVRWRAVETLRKVGPPGDAFPLLALALRSDSCRSVRWRAAEALGAPSLPAKERAKALLQASGDTDHWVRWHAHRVLTEVVDSTLLRSLLPYYAAESPEAAVRAYALRLLAGQDRFGLKDLRQLVAGLWEGEPEVRRCTMELIARHGMAEHDRQARSGLGLCLQDLRPELRESAVRAIGGLARHSTASRMQLEGTLGDPDPAVRAAVCEELSHAKGSVRGKRQWLRAGLSDPALPVRLRAALALHRLEVEDAAVVAALASTLWQAEPPLEGWRALLTLTSRHEDRVIAAVSALPSSVLRYLIAEDVAAGTLPTVGLRLWHSKARIRFPNKEGGDLRSVGLGYPWVNAGVHHSWESHKPPLRSRIHGVVKQVSLAVEPFPYAHLIAAVELSRYLPSGLDGRTAPVHIEGRPVGSIIEGGNVSGLLDPAGIPRGAFGRGRLDFLFAIDLQLCQYGSFGAICERSHPGHQQPAERSGARAWQRLVERLSQVLADFGLREFVEGDWFDPSGWESSRYGRRHERHYEDIREGVAQLLAKLRSPDGRRLRGIMIDAAGEFTGEVEAALWSARLSDYPPQLLPMLASGAAGERAVFHAGRVQQYRPQANDVRDDS
jgi:HEAT repeat protein